MFFVVGIIVGKKVNKEISRNLIEVKPPDPCHVHAKGGFVCPLHVDIDDKKGASKTQDHN